MNQVHTCMTHYQAEEHDPSPLSPFVKPLAARWNRCLITSFIYIVTLLEMHILQQSKMRDILRTRRFNFLQPGGNVSDLELSSSFTISNTSLQCPSNSSMDTTTSAVSPFNWIYNNIAMASSSIRWVHCFTDEGNAINVTWQCAKLTVPIDYRNSTGKATTQWNLRNQSVFSSRIEDVDLHRTLIHSKF